MASSISRSVVGRLIFTGRRGAALGAPSALRRTFTEAVARGPARLSFSTSSSSVILGQLLELLQDRLTDSPPWRFKAKEHKDSLHLLVDMPGLGKEHNIEVGWSDNTLIIKGEGNKNDEESDRLYINHVKLPLKLYKMDEFQASMQNGVFKMVVPKVSEEELYKMDKFQAAMQNVVYKMVVPKVNEEELNEVSDE